MADEEDQGTVLDRAKKEFPVLQGMDLGYKESFGRSKGYLESWPPGEGGSPDLPRPAELPNDKFGLEIYDPKTSTLDIMGDVASHKMINDDPTVKKTYDDFVSSLKPWQKKNLKAQYEHAKANYGENRSYDDWEKSSGMPAYFRGYAFKQWDDPKEFYTPGQMKKFDAMMGYLRGKEKKQTRGSVLYDNSGADE